MSPVGRQPSLAVLCALASACGGASLTNDWGPDPLPVAAAEPARPVHSERIHRMNRPVAPAPLSCTARYYGGRVLSSVEAIDVRWGADLDPTVTGDLPSFLRAVTDSSYLDWLSEYDTAGVTPADGRPGTAQGISRGSFGGSYTISPSLCASVAPGGHCTLGDSDISAELVAQIDAGHLPAPTVGCDGEPRTLYIVQFARGVIINDGSGPTSNSCSAFCAYHSTTLISGRPLAYAVIPFMGQGSGCATPTDATPPTACGSTVYLDRLTSTVSHELVEAITDPDIGLAAEVARPIAWYAPGARCGELGDLCTTDGTIDAFGQTWVVQTIWSNQAGGCVVTGPSDPLCHGAKGGFCQCTAEDGGGPEADGGTEPDAGSNHDGGAGRPDAGGAPDSGASADAGHETIGDAGGGSTSSDGGSSDGGPTVVDAGRADTEPESGDPGAPGTPTAVGCGCRSEAEAGAMLAPLTGLFLMRRRRAE